METNPFSSNVIRYLIMIAVPILIFGIVWVIVWVKNYFSKRTTDIETGIQDEVLKDKRRPILYLRSFKIDGSEIDDKEMTVPDIKIKLKLPTQESRDIFLNQENFFRRKFLPIGPLISIGDPKKKDFAISRIHSSENEWKRIAEKCMIKSRIIILRTSSGLTPGVYWELQIILDRFLEKTLFFVESNESELKLELDRQLKLKYPHNKQWKNEFRVGPYYFWVEENGKKKYHYFLKYTNFFKKYLKASQTEYH